MTDFGLVEQFSNSPYGEILEDFWATILVMVDKNLPLLKA